ncbi:hypothetical protein LAY57_23875 [Argonema antarcticum A004/B2]|nr:hypothetical protein [Argonema antarcticum A004/B2]
MKISSNPRTALVGNHHYLLSEIGAYLMSYIMSGCIGSVSVMREIVCGHRELNFNHR